jgi:hypothetical protein
MPRPAGAVPLNRLPRLFGLERAMTNKRVGRYNKDRTRYQPLVDYLAASSETEIVLTFEQIEGIVGIPLTDVARVNTYFWVWPQFLYVQRWRALGWRARLDKANRRVIFSRDAEG